ncbi:MAG: Crp/Fnr family transcriptional regulator [Pseudomonadota bacterium]
MTVFENQRLNLNGNDNGVVTRHPIALPAALVEYVKRASTVIESSNRQALSTSIEDAETVYLPVRGTLLIDGGVYEQRPRILGLLYPGDLVRSSTVPPFDGTAIIASGSSVTLRLSALKLRQLEQQNPPLADWVSQASARMQGRLRFHIASLSSLSSEKRVLGFLAELGFRLNQNQASTASFELPVSRMEMASYLALNADTLSRIMSKLRSDGLISTSGRNWITLLDFPRLLRLYPFAGSLTELHRLR